MKIAFIHNDKKIGTGAHYINDLVSIKLREQGNTVKNFYPKTQLLESPSHLKGLANILFFYSLLSKKSEILKYDLIHGTTYTPLPFLAFSIPVVSHFGSTTAGFLVNTPRAADIENDCQKIWYDLRAEKIIQELNLKTRRPLRDIAEIEQYVALRAQAVIATSQKVREELIAQKVPAEKIHVIHNAIEDYWFEFAPLAEHELLPPGVVFLGRLGEDAFTLKLKGVDRVIQLFKKLPHVRKDLFCITQHKILPGWLSLAIPQTFFHQNILKEHLPPILAKRAGSALFISSRYEGFSLSLIEGMSQGLIPVSYPVGVAPEIIKNGENGFLVHNQLEALAAVEKILSLAASERIRMIHASQATARLFTSSEMISKLKKTYTAILKECE